MIEEPVAQGLSELRGSLDSLQNSQENVATLTHDVKITGGALANLRQDIRRVNTDVQGGLVTTKINEAHIQSIREQLDRLDQVTKANSATTVQLGARLQHFSH